MKKVFLASLLSMTLLANSLGVVSAETSIVIPTAEEQNLTDLQLEKINGFLKEYQIVSRCLKGGNKGNKAISLTQAVCTVLQVFDLGKNTQHENWGKAIKLGLIGKDKKKTDKLTGFEYLRILFEAAGVSISPVTETTYQTLFRKQRMLLKKEDSVTLAIAMEQGLIKEPASPAEGKALQNRLGKNPIIVNHALAYLYQVATSEHDNTTIIHITPIAPDPAKKLPFEDVLKEVFKIIKTQSYFAESFDEKKAMEEAIKAAVKTLTPDKYIEYYSSEEFKSFSQGLNGNLEGIGAYIEEKEGKIIIVSPIEGSPAQKAGILPGDLILLIDGQSTEKLSLQQAVDKIRGPQGTIVKLKIKRNGSELEISITRNRITVPAITVSSRDNIEIIKLVQFGSSSAHEMKTELDTIAGKNPKAIIIDLRNNPGGFLDEVVDIVDNFLEKGKPIVYLKDKHEMTSMNDLRDPLITNIPIGILINKGSASASEILAGVLQSYGIARIYGETSFGKGTVQNIMSLQAPGENELSAFKFTTAEYLIPVPGGEPKSINGTGVLPDSNPAGATSLLDDRLTPVDEALEAVINDLKNR